MADFSAISQEDATAAAAAAAARRSKAAAAHEAALAAVKAQEEADAALEADSEFWTRLIPEDRRPQKEEEEEDDEVDDAMRAHGYVPARKAALAVKSLNETKMAEDAAKTSSGVVNKGKRKLTKKQREARSKMDVRDVRVLIRGMMRFGWQDEDKPPRLDEIMQQGKLEKKDRTMLIQVGTECVREAQKAMLNPQPKPEGANSKFNPYVFDFKGEQVKADEFLERLDGLLELHNQLVALGPRAKSFRLPTALKAPSGGWKVGWSPADDAMLLVGVYKFGFGSWQAMRDEPQLQLGSKIAPTQGQALAAIQEADKAAGTEATLEDQKKRATVVVNEAKGPKGSQLSRRSDQLLKMLAAMNKKRRSTSQEGEAAKARRVVAAQPKGAHAKLAAKRLGLDATAIVQRVEQKPVQTVEPKTSQPKPQSKPSSVVVDDNVIVQMTDEQVDMEMYGRARAYMSRLRPKLDEMHKLPEREDLSQQEKKEQTKQYLVSIGTEIERMVYEKGKSGTYSKSWLGRFRNHLWHYMSKYTTTNAPTLEKMFLVLKKN